MKNIEGFPEYEGYIYRIDGFIKDGFEDSTVFATIDKEEYLNYGLLKDVISGNKQKLRNAKKLLEEKIQMRSFPMFLDKSLVNCLIKVQNVDLLLPNEGGRVHVHYYALEVKSGPDRGLGYTYNKK